MEIVKAGRNLEKPWWGKCDVCGAVVKASTHELKVTEGDYRSDNEAYAWIDCPQCGSKAFRPGSNDKPGGICLHQEGTKSCTELKGKEGVA